MITAATTTSVLALHSHTTLAHTHHSNGIGGGLAHTFVHSAVSSFAWHGVGELFRYGHGAALVVFLGLAVVVGVYFLTRRARS